MSKKANFFIFLIIVLLAVLCLIIISETIQKSDQQQVNKNDNKNQVKNEQLENNYKEQVKLIFARYLELVEGESYSYEQISIIKSELLNLKVPTKFKDLHLDLVFIMTKMEDYLTEGSEAARTESQQLVSRVKANYMWLN